MNRLHSSLDTSLLRTFGSKCGDGLFRGRELAMGIPPATSEIAYRPTASSLRPNAGTDENHVCSERAEVSQVTKAFTPASIHYRQLRQFLQ